MPNAQDCDAIFLEHFRSIAADERFPFLIEFDDQPVFDINTEERKVGNLSIPTFGGLTAAETWYFERVQKLQGNPQQQAIRLVMPLLKKMVKAFPQLDYTRAYSLVVSVITGKVEVKEDEEILESEAFQELIKSDTTTVEEMVSLLYDSAVASAAPFYKALFFLKSRLGNQFTAARLQRMPVALFQEIQEIITSEVNGGEEVEPEDGVSLTDTGEASEPKKA